MALKNYLDYDGVLYLKQKLQTWISSKFALKADMPTVEEKAAWNAKQDPLTIDSTLSETSTNPIQNKPVSEALDMKVDKIEGKGLSANDFTTQLKTNYDTAYAHSKTAHAPVNAERNTIVGIQKNGGDVAIDSSTRKINITIPTRVSDLSNDSEFQTQGQVNAAITAAVGDIAGIEYIVLKTGEYNSDGVPTVSGIIGKIYLVPKNPVEAANIYVEWIYVNNAFEKIGDTAIDLSGYVKASDLIPLTNNQIDEIMNTA